MSCEDNHRKKRERTPKRRSSIKKRQDTCVISENGDDGSRTPRRVSFATNTMIMEYYPIPWASRDDSSDHSSRSNQSSSTSSSEDANEYLFSKASQQRDLSGHNSLSFPGAIESTVVQELEIRDQHHETSTFMQNKTIHFQDLDGSIGDMNLTSNIMELSTSVYQEEKDNIDPASVLSWVCNEPSCEKEDPGEQNWVASSLAQHSASTKHLTRGKDHMTMEMTHNIDTADYEDINDFTHKRQHSDKIFLERTDPMLEYTEDMELTADVTYSSRAALVEIVKPNSPTGSTQRAKKNLLKPVSTVVRSEDQENNPLVILQTVQVKQAASVKTNSMMNDSNMELTTDVPGMLRDDSQSLSLVSAGLVSGHLTSYVTRDFNSGDNRDKETKINIDPSRKHDENSLVAPGKKRGQLMDPLSLQALSPVMEISGLNSLSWHAGQASSSLHRSSMADSLAEPISPDKSVMQNSVTDQGQVEPSTKTMYFGSHETSHAQGPVMMENAGDMELTKPCMTSVIDTAATWPESMQYHEDIPVSGLRHSYMDQDVEMNVSMPSQEHMEPSTKTMYFGSSEAPQALDPMIMESAGDMELTKPCITSVIDTNASWPASIQHKVQAYHGPEDASTSDRISSLDFNESPGTDLRKDASPLGSEKQAKTIYFGSGGAAGESGDMELTDAVLLCSKGRKHGNEDDDNFGINTTVSGQSLHSSIPSEESIPNLVDQNSQLNPAQTNNLNRSGRLQETVAGSLNKQERCINKGNDETDAGLNTLSTSHQSKQSGHYCNHEADVGLNELSTSHQSKQSGHYSLTSVERDPKYFDCTGIQNELRSENFKSSLSVGICHDSEASSAGTLEISSQPNRNPSESSKLLEHHRLVPSIKIANNDISKKKDVVKNKLVKEMGNFLSLSRRSSNIFNVRNPRKSFGGLLLGDHDKGSSISCRDFSEQQTKSLTQSSNVNNSEDEVDGRINFSVRDTSLNKLFQDLGEADCSLANISGLKEKNPMSLVSPFGKTVSSEVISVFSETSSSQVDSKNSIGGTVPYEHNSVVMASRSNKAKSPLQTPSRVENSFTGSSQIQKHSLTNTSSEKISSTFLPVPNRSISNQVSCPPESVEPGLSESASMGNDADLTEEHEMLDLTEELNIHNVLGECTIDEEVVEDGLQDLKCAMSEGVYPEPVPEKPFTLPEMYDLIGFDNTTAPQDEILPQMQVGNSSIAQRLTDKIAVLPQIEALQQFVKTMDHIVNKLREENSERIAVAREDLSKVNSLLIQGKDNLRLRALEMCKACRRSSRTKWRQYSADHLIEHSSLRERAFGKFNSDVEFFKKDTSKSLDLAKEIDKCLQEVNLIQEVNKELRQQETKLAGTKNERNELRQKSEQLDTQVKSIKASEEELTHNAEKTVAAQEEVEEQLYWLRSFTEWHLLQQSDKEMHFGFLFNTLVLQVGFEDFSVDDRRITSLTLKSRLAGASKPWAKLSHHLAATSIDCVALKNQYSSRDQLSKLLLDVSTVVCNCRHLGAEIRQAHLKYRVSIHACTLQVYILERKHRQKIRLQTHFESPCDYPNSKLSWSAISIFGNADSETIVQAINQVLPGHQYLTRALTAVETSLVQSNK
ncbi:kinetochore scaffold 1 [Plakobranchus ocellatus]|uniref:Kinetochore scaffold 1 n=1 Tax=Plakobranchus ocellatus TaxID=259542 RepID=A0AAV4CM03_9GAST|nr:kinetochore scaffold 1 [Plakobranchus ocellatus]